MSLKAFHIVFVAVCLLFAVFFGVWCTVQYLEHGEMMHLGFAVGSAAALGGLAWYGVWMLHKLRGYSLI